MRLELPRETLYLFFYCAQGEACHSGSCVQTCKNHEHCGLNESCCRHEERSGVCRGSCLGNSCKNNQHCAPGEHCSGKISKCVATTGKVDVRHATQKTETKSETGWRIAVALVTPFTVVVVCLCVGCCSRKRKASRESRESIRQRHENRQIPIRRTVEQHEVKRQSQQQCQSQI